MSRDVGHARGVLKPAPGPGAFQHARIAPSAALADVVQHYWAVRWDLRGHPAQTRETLPHPNVHWVFRDGEARVHGIHSGRFTTSLQDRGGVFGVKFRAGGFRNVLGRSVSTLRDRSLPVSDISGLHADSFSGIDPLDEDDMAKIAVVEHALLGLYLPSDADAILAGEIVEFIESDRQLYTVEQLTSRWAIGRRSLQRLFNEYVGMGPKWVINRYRIHEVIERLAKGTPADWSGFAIDLGYFDQAHFIRDFRRLVGCTPSAYTSSQSARNKGAC